RTLSGDCPACVAANGQTVPKPAFTSSGSGSATLPSGITTATLSGDTLFVTIQNGYNFDPIRPGAGNNGFIVIAVKSGAATIRQGLRDRVQSGSLFLTIVNPFAVTGNLTLTISGGPTPVTKTVTLAAGTSNVKVDFNQAEIRSVLAAKTLSFSGTIAGATAVT